MKYLLIIKMIWPHYASFEVKGEFETLEICLQVLEKTEFDMSKSGENEWIAVKTCLPAKNASFK